MCFFEGAILINADWASEFWLAIGSMTYNEVSK